MNVTKILRQFPSPKTTPSPQLAPISTTPIKTFLFLLSLPTILYYSLKQRLWFFFLMILLATMKKIVPNPAKQSLSNMCII